MASLTRKRPTASASKRGRGRPRSERARDAILSSTLALLRDVGFADLTIEDIAARAAVGKPTVYRWWGSKAELVADAFISSVEKKLHYPDTGSVVEDMKLHMNSVVRVLRGPRGRIVSALIGGGQSNPELLRAFRERYLRPHRQEARETLERGVARGEISPDLNLDLVLDALYGPIYMRFLVRHNVLTNTLGNQIWDLVINGSKKC